MRVWTSFSVSNLILTTQNEEDYVQQSFFGDSKFSVEKNLQSFAFHCVYSAKQP
jgi:hypothetical protein